MCQFVTAPGGEVYLTGLEQDKIWQEFQELLAQIQDLGDILARPERLLTVIRAELEDIRAKYADPRRTEIEAYNAALGFAPGATPLTWWYLPVQRAHLLLNANKVRPEQSTTGDLRQGRRAYVFERPGQPCRRCGTSIRTEEFGPPGQERRSYWCPRCQPQR